MVRVRALPFRPWLFTLLRSLKMYPQIFPLMASELSSFNSVSRMFFVCAHTPVWVLRSEREIESD